MTPSSTSSELRLVRAGARLNHDQHYRVDRPHGTGDWLFVQFLTPIVHFDGNSEQTLPVGTCILFSPGRPQRYQPLPGRGYCNNWCHFDGAGADALVARMKVPTDVPLQSHAAQPLGALCRMLAQETIRRDPWWNEAGAALITQLIVAFARACQGPQLQSTDPARRALTSRLHDLRATVLRRVTHPWTVAEMASLANLSPSRFAHLYREVFGAGPMNDLIDARIARACELLSQGTALVKAVATAAGFSDQHHFSKSFRARMGCTPSAYARDQHHDLP